MSVITSTNIDLNSVEDITDNLSTLNDTVTKSAIEITTTGTITTEQVVVNQETFANTVTDYGSYAFTYNGTNWTLNENTIDLTVYGITLSTTAASGDTFTVNYGDSGLVDNLSGLQKQLYGEDNNGGDIGSINSNINNVNSQLETYNGYIEIDKTKPSITLGKNLNTKLVLESQKLGFITDGNEAASLENDRLNADSVLTTNIYMQTIDAITGESIGQLGWVARSNGHLSLKVIK